MYFDFNGVLIGNPIGNSNKFHDEAIMWAQNNR